MESKNRWTVEEYMLMEVSAPYQLINYELIYTPSRTIKHQNVMMKFLMLISAFLEETKDKGLLIMGPIDVVLDEGNVFQPDWVYVCEARKNELVKDNVQGAPDLIVEILMPETAAYDIGVKKQTCEKFGVKEYIIIDPDLQNAEVYVLKDDAFFIDQKVESPESFHSHVLKGFSVNLQEIFAQ